MATPPCSACGSTRGPEHPCPGQGAQLVGKVLDGRYEIQAVLGHGGMGMVFQALQTSVRRQVAVKTLHPALAAAPTFFERFRREAEIASRLRHPNVITIFDFGRAEDGTCYYVMELLQGESLKQQVKRDGPMSLRRAVRVVGQACLGLAHAHIQGCVHRDLKPHNIMVQHIDGQEFVKVLDFGLVKALEEDDNEQLTSTGQVLGTPQYMPPEQAGGEVVDARSDLYSMTGVFYFCLTGSSPFGANTVRKALTSALTKPVPPVASHRKGAPVPKEIDELFRRGLAAEKESRHQSAEQLIAEMNSAISDLSDDELDALPDGRIDDGKDSGIGSRQESSGRASKSRPRAPRPATPPPDPPHQTVPEVPSLGVSAQPPAAVGARPLAHGKRVAFLAVLLSLFLASAAVVFKVRVAPAEAPPVPRTPSTPEITVKLVTVPSGAAVLEDGIQIGTTPFDYRAPRSAVRALSFQLANHLEAKRSFKFSSDEKVEVLLEPAPRPSPVKPPPAKKKGSDIPIFE